MPSVRTSLRRDSNTGCSSPGDWACPAIDIRRPIWDVKHTTKPLIIDGTVDVDTRFFHRDPASAPTPFAITIALTAPDSGSLRPLDWNQEATTAATPSNPLSTISIGQRITIDKELCCVSFKITLPPSLLPRSGGQRHFGIAVKAYESSVAPVGERLTSGTNIALFYVRNSCDVERAVNTPALSPIAPFTIQVPSTFKRSSLSVRRMSSGRRMSSTMLCGLGVDLVVESGPGCPHPHSRATKFAFGFGRRGSARRVSGGLGTRR